MRISCFVTQLCLLLSMTSQSLKGLQVLLAQRDQLAQHLLHLLEQLQLETQELAQ